MKNVKKIVGLLVVLAMAICMTIPAYAAGEGSITIENYDATKDYTAHKLFDVVYDKTDGNYAYTITSDSPWFVYINAYASDASKGLVLTQVNGSKLYTVTFTDAFRAADLAYGLADDAKTMAGGTKFTSKTLTGLDLGYYLVSTTSGVLCNLTTTDPTETIYDKNEKQTITKTVDATEVEVGQKIRYTITGKIPSITGYEEYLYEITDTMSEGLTFNKDVTIQFGDEEVIPTETLLAGGFLTNNENGFVLTCDMVYLLTEDEGDYYVGETITVTYTATVNENAIGDGEELVELGNNATLVYSDDPNNPTTSGGQTTTKTDVSVYLTNIVVDKYATGSGNKLAGAEFKLYKLGENNTKEYYKWNDTTKAVEWLADGDTVITDANGAASFDGVKAGTYYLEEIKAPDGYNRLSEDVEVVVTTDADASGKVVVEGNVVSVGNQAGFLLPSTGGIGTTIFYILGTVLIAGAFILIVTKKRMSTEK